jgi:hypothetical protein
MTKSVEVINGSQQPVYSIPLQTLPGYDISIPAILDRVIVGPARLGFQEAVAESLIHELTLAGVPDAGSKVFFSNIPLRM